VYERTARRLWTVLAVRVVLPSALCLALYSVAIYVIILPAFEQGLLARKKEMIRALTQTVHAALSRFHERVTLGELTLDEAQAAAIAHVRGLRYGPDRKDYFWISDLRPYMIMHPYLPELDGQDLTNYADPGGTRLFYEFAQIVRRDGSGYVRYLWQWKDAPGKVAPKLSYVEGFEPWGWIVGTGMYMDDVAAEIGALSRKLGLAAALILGAVTLLSAFVIWQSYQFERRRHGAAEELRASEIRFRELFNNMSSGVVVGVATDEGADFILKDLNHAAEQLTGVNRATALNRSFLDVFAAFRDGGLLEVLQRVWRTGLPEFHAHTRRSAGRVTLSTESYVYRLPAHEVVIVTDDVTERERAQAALRESEAGYRLLAENATDMIARHAPDGSALYVSPACRALLGCEPDELIGRTPFDVAHPDDLPALRRALEQIMGPEGIGVTTYRCRRKDGAYVWLETVARAIRDPACGVIRELISVARDVTERKRAEEEHAALREQLHQAQKMEAIGQLAGGVAHDFNNLLTVILGSIDQLKRTLPEGGDPSPALDAMERAVDQAAGVTRSLLTFSHKLPTEKRPVELGVLVEGAARLLRRVLPTAIELVVETNRKAPVWVNADATQIQQVLLNLAINARDAMPEGGTLRIALGSAEPAQVAPDLRAMSPAHGFVQLAVSDTGTGIPAEIQSRIFEPFFTTKERGQGTGLGLAIVHGIVQDHGGAIAVDSAVGAGTTFRVWLPRIASAAASAARPAAAAPPRGRGELVLLAEDNQLAREILVAELRSQGYTVRSVGDGPALLEAVGRYGAAVRLLIVDVDIPKRSGLECLAELRRAGNQTPAIVVTGTVHTGLEDELHGDTILLRKPFQMAELGRLATALLDAANREEALP